VVVQGLSFLRNIIVARLVTPADFGIAATLAATVSLLEMTSDLNVGTLLIQAPDGGAPRFQDSAQSVGILRGCLNAVALLLVAWPLSRLFGVPQATWAFLTLALYPLITGFVHLDPIRAQREMRFTPSVLQEVAGQVVAAVAAYPVAAALRSYAALLWLLLLQRGVSSVASFALSRTPFRLAWDAGYVRRIFSFGWPLLLNGVLLFLMTQGDRVVIGSAPRLFRAATYTMADLGLYSAAFALAGVGASFLTKVTLSVMLPALADARESRERFDSRYSLFAQVLAITGGLMAVSLVVAGGPIISIVYGRQYSGASALIGWLGVMQAIRVIRTGPTMAALARGDARNPLISNVARAGGLLAVIALAAIGAPLRWLPAAGSAGELLALAVSAIRLERTGGPNAGVCLRPAALAIVGILVSWSVVVLGVGRFGLLGCIGATAGISLLLLGVWATTFPVLTREVTASLRQLIGSATP
jgi:O-antigen/teichoic acid export membrane protein